MNCNGLYVSDSSDNFIRKTVDLFVISPLEADHDGHNVILSGFSLVEEVILANLLSVVIWNWDKFLWTFHKCKEI